ncbi:MAG: type VI secretion system tube protein TssD [Bacteroidetes bacterium]|nr:type VI secretion system tube protein TssD [Bacteroidota bacterium]
MSFKAKLTVGSNVYNVVSCSYGLHQSVDGSGRPTSEVKSHDIIVVVESNEDNSLMEWAVGSYAKKSGNITFNKIDQDQKMKQLDYTDGYLTSYSESFGGDTMMMTLAISARVIKVGNAEVDNNWPK